MMSLGPVYTFITFILGQFFKPVLNLWNNQELADKLLGGVSYLYLVIGFFCFILALNLFIIRPLQGGTIGNLAVGVVRNSSAPVVKQKSNKGGKPSVTVTKSNNSTSSSDTLTQKSFDVDTAYNNALSRSARWMESMMNSGDSNA